MEFDDIIYLSESDLNYGGVTTSRTITRRQFFEIKRYDGRYLRERCSFTRYNEIQREMSSRAYDLAIQKKYKVGPDWRQNRWFVEQVRPSLG